MGQGQMGATAGQVGRPPRTKLVVQDPVVDSLQPVLQELGLYGYQARVLLALFQVRSASGVDLATLAGIPRSSVYPVLNELTARGLVAQVPGKAALWISLGQDEVLDRLYAEQEERLRDLSGKVVQAREMMARMAGPSTDESLPHMQVIHSAQQARAVFEQCVAATRTELLMFTRLPVSSIVNEPSPVVLARLERGIAARVLYQASDLMAARGGPLPQALDRYHAAGADARVVENLPMKLAIFDRKAVLLALSDPVLPEVGFPVSQLVRHAGYAGLLVRAFDDLWADAQPYESWVESAGASTGPVEAARPRRRAVRPSSSPRRVAG